VVSSGNWSKLQFTPQENATGTVNIVEHFQELLPAKGGTIGLITAQNGISTSPIELARNVQTIANKIPEGTLIIGMYNPTRGIFRDVKRTFSENKGRDTPTVVRTRQFMIAISHTLHRLNPELLWLHIPHSEAGVIANNAIKGMTDEQKRKLKHQLHIMALGPAKPIPTEFGKEVVNIYSRQDFITGVFALKSRNDPRYDIRFVKCISKFSERTGYIADHAFLGGTYQKVLQGGINELRSTEGFYNDKMH
jgi:hypothetical protein